RQARPGGHPFGKSPGLRTMPQDESQSVRYPKSTARHLLLAAVCVLIGAALMLGRVGVSGLASLRYLGHRAVIGVLATMLAGYLAFLPAAVVGTILSGWLAWGFGRPRAKPFGIRRMRSTRMAALRCLLVCGSTVIATASAEMVSAIWLA